MQRNRITPLLVALTVLPLVVAAHAQQNDLDLLNHNKPMLDAHNCYPTRGNGSDRVSRALNSGFPVSIEQDLAWYSDPATGKDASSFRTLLKPTGQEPTLKSDFFEQVKPVVRKDHQGEQAGSVAPPCPSLRLQR